MSNPFASRQFGRMPTFADDCSWSSPLQCDWLVRSASQSGRSERRSPRTSLIAGQSALLGNAVRESPSRAPTTTRGPDRQAGNRGRQVPELGRFRRTASAMVPPARPAELHTVVQVGVRHLGVVLGRGSRRSRSASPKQSLAEPQPETRGDQTETSQSSQARQVRPELTSHRQDRRCLDRPWRLSRGHGRLGRQHGRLGRSRRGRQHRRLRNLARLGAQDAREVEARDRAGVASAEVVVVAA